MTPKQSLTEKLLAQSLAIPARGRSNRNIVQFIAKQEEVREALRNGWSMKAIWKNLHQDGLFLGEYSSFTKYVKKFIRAETHIRATVNGALPSTVEVAATLTESKNGHSALPQSFHHDPVPPNPGTLF